MQLTTEVSFCAGMPFCEMRIFASLDESIFLPSAVSRFHALGVVKTLWRNEDDMTVTVVPVSGVTLAWKEDPAWLKIIGILGVGRDKGVRLFVVARSMQVDPLEDTDSIGSNVSAYEGGGGGCVGCWGGTGAALDLAVLADERYFAKHAASEWPVLPQKVQLRLECG